MKKKITMITGAVALTGLLGFGVYQTTVSASEPSISDKEVEKLVTAQYPGTITELELEKENRRLVYEIEIESDGVEYDLKVDADTGEILKMEKDFRDVDDEDDRNDISEEVVVAGEEKVKAPNEKTTKDTFIGENKAIEIALAKFPGKVEDVELDEDDGRYIYEIEIENNDRDAEFEIDAKTGKILEMKIDD